MLKYDIGSAQKVSGENFSELIYPTESHNIDFATLEIAGRQPANGYQYNEICEELLYIMQGEGRVLFFNGKTIEVREGDVIILLPQEEYAFDGHFKAIISCSPAWTKSQHKYTVEKSKTKGIS